MESAHSDSAEEIATLRRLLAERDAALATAAIEIEHLKLQLAMLRRARFGRSSEKLDAEIDQLELRLEDLEETEAADHGRRNQDGARASAPRFGSAQATAHAFAA